jgi:hypothetical protein
MSEGPDKGPASRFVEALRRFNRQPRLVMAARHTRVSAQSGDTVPRSSEAGVVRWTDARGSPDSD